MTKIILGLGNPGAEYSGTRHNVGFHTVDTLARRHGIRLDTRRSQSRLGEGHIADVEVTLVKPQTFMNLSGNAALSLLARYRVSPQDLVVICDDIHLDLGRIRVRAGGSAGGHNGLKSIIACVGSDQFPRVRIGVGAPGQGDWIDHVLGEFTREERPRVQDAIETAADAVEMLLREGVEAAANRFNRKLSPDSAEG